MQAEIIAAYQDEKQRAKLPGYVCTYDDYDSDYDDTFGIEEPAGRGVRAHAAQGPRVAHMAEATADVR